MAPLMLSVRPLAVNIVFEIKGKRMKRKFIRSLARKKPATSTANATDQDTMTPQIDAQHSPSINEQTNKELTEHKQYWQQVGSIVLGAIIASVSSGVVTYMQGKAQSKQFLVDKQITALKEYSTSFNQSSSSALAKIRTVNQKLEMFLFLGPENVPDEELDEIFKLSSEMMTESYTFRANLITQRTMVYATFGMETPSIPFLDFSSDEEFVDFKQKLFDKLKQYKEAKSKVKENIAMREIVTMFYDFISSAETETIESINQENQDIRSLAERIHKEY